MREVRCWIASVLKELHLGTRTTVTGLPNVDLGVVQVQLCDHSEGVVHFFGFFRTRGAAEEAFGFRTFRTFKLFPVLFIKGDPFLFPCKSSCLAHCI